MASLKLCENQHLVEGEDQYYCRQCGSVDLVPADAAGRPIAQVAAPAPPHPLTAPTALAGTVSSRTARAREQLRSLVMWGAGLYLVASLLVGLIYVSLLGDSDGSYGGQLFALVLLGLAATVGLALLAVALIGYGVRLGREASDVGP